MTDRVDPIKMTDRVECRSDHEYAQRPVAFYWQGKRLEIVEVLAHWRIPEGYSFRVRNEVYGIFELNYDIDTDEWSINQP